MTKILWPAGTMLGPVPPVLVSCGTVEKPNALTVAWTGIVNSEPPMAYISVRPSRYSHDLIKEAGEFVINLSNLALSEACDFCGVKSGETVDKFTEMNLTALPCEHVAVPQIAQSPVSLECRIQSVTNFGTHDMFLAEIVGVYVDDEYISEEGKLCLEKAGLLAFMHGAYYTLGREVGSFGFSVNKKLLKKKTLKMAETQNEGEIIEGTEEGEEMSEKEPRKDKFMINRFAKKSMPKRPAFGDRPKRDFGDRPPRKDFGDRPARPFGDRPARPFGDRPARPFGDRPARPFGDRPARPFGDRPARSFDDRPKRDFGDRPPRKDFGDRPPRKDFGDRPPRKDFGDRPPRKDFGDRPPRKDFGDRPARPFGDRPARSFDDRPKRDFGDRPPRKDFGDRPARPFGDRPKRDFGDRPPRKDFGDRPARPFGDRPKRDFGDRPARPFGDRPKRDFGDRPPRKDFGDRPRRSFGDKPRGDK